MTCCTHFENESIETLGRSESNIFPAVNRLFAVLDLWNKRQIERKQLAGVDERLLKDMGISSYQANREIKKPFWRE